MAVLNMNEGAANAIDCSNDGENSPTSPPRLVNIAIDSSLDINNNNANRLSTPKSLQDIKEESYNNGETESAVECINQLSFSSPTTTKMTTLCNNTIGSTSSSTSNDSNNKPPTANDNNNTSLSDCNNDSPTMKSDTNNSACSTKLPPSSSVSTVMQNEQSSSKLDVTITVLSLHGVISKHVDKKSSNPLSGGSGTNSSSGGSKKKKKGSSKKKDSGGGDKNEEKKEENATIVASFTQQVTKDKVFLTHVPSLPVSLNSGTSNDSVDEENNGKKKKKGKGEELQSLNVNWACSESLGDDARSAPYALSTINFTKEFIHENNNKLPSSKLSIATTNNNNRGVNGTMSNNSSNISVDASTNSKQSKSSTIKSSSTGRTNSNNNGKKTNNKQHYIPQTIPVNLSISRSGKMILLGKVNLVVNGEESGESSLSVPIISSIKDNTKKLKPIKKLKLRKNKSGSGGGSEVQSNSKGSSEAENKGMVKMKGDSYSFGLDNNAMLRVLVNVTNPNNKDTVAKDDDVDFDATVQGSIEDCNEEQDDNESSMLMEGLSIEQVSSNDSLSLEEHDYCYASYIPVSNELRTLRTQIQQLDNTNKVLQMELATANNTISNECNMVAALHDENKLLREELEDVHVELEELLMSNKDSSTTKEIELEDENEELKCQIEQLRMRLDALPVLQEEVETLRNELAIARDTSQGSSDSSSSCSPTTTTTADAIAATLRVENTKLRSELIRAQSNATTLLGELNTSKSESEMLPFYERRVNELLEELKKRDLEVCCLKDELSEANARAKSSLVEGLLWDDDDDNEEDVEEDNTAAGGGGGANRLSLAARKLAAAAESHVLAKHGLKARDEGESSSSLDDEDGEEEPQVQVQDEEGKKLLAEIDRIYADKSANESGDTDSTSTPSTEESIDKAAKGSSGDDTSSVADTEATTPERDTSADAVDSPLIRDWGSPVDQAAPSFASSSEDATNDDDDTKKQGSRGLGLRGLGSRLKAAEEKMRERQQLFREQQQKVLAEQQRLAELEKQNAEPGLSDVLMARMASSRKTSDNDKDEGTQQENTKEDSATQDEGPQDKEEAPLSSAAGDDDSSMDTAAKAQVSNTLKEIEAMSNEATRRESQQGLLLENMDSLEQEFGLRTMASHDELASASCPASGDPNKDLEGSTVSKEKKSKSIMSRIKKVGRKNKKSKEEEEGIEEKDAIKEEVDSQTQPGGSTSTEAQDLSEPEEEDNDSYKEFIQIISTDELDRKESTGSSAENHIGTVVA